MEDIVERLRKDIEEWKRLGEICQRPKVKDGIEIEVRRSETALIKELEKRDLNSAKDAATEKKKTVSSAARSYDVQIKNYSWDQSDKFVKVYLTGLKGVQDLPKESVTQEFGKKSARVRVEGLKGQNPTFFVGELCKEIDPDKSYVKVKSDMVSVFLAKSESGSKWAGLRPTEPPKSVPKMDENSADPSAGLMSMMKQMYDDGDDDMKRTINKAWSESRGNNPMGGMGGGGGGMGGLGGLLNDPELMASMTDPEVAAAFKDIMSNPGNIMKYQGNPKVMALLQKMAGKMGGGGGGGMGGMMGGLGGMMGGMGGGMPGGMGGMGGGMPGGMPGGMGGATGSSSSSGGSAAPPPPKPPASSTDDLD